MQTRLLLADDHALIRQGLRAFLEKQGFQIVCEASDGQEALRSVQKTQPDVAIIDISMPVLNGVVMELQDCAFPLLAGIVATVGIVGRADANRQLVQWTNQEAVPTVQLAEVKAVTSMSLAMPKSVSLSVPSDRIMRLDGLRSRWTMPAS